MVTATNRDPLEEIRAGRLRQDLYDRLSIVPLHVPPLRERGEDIELLAHYFLDRFNQRLSKNLMGITSETLGALRSYLWPGNIRQLENVIERMVLLSENSILEFGDLPRELASAVPHGTGDFSDLTSEGLLGSTPFKERVRRQTQGVERELIEKALEETGGNVTRAAERLGLSRKGLQLKLKELRVVGWATHPVLKETSREEHGSIQAIHSRIRAAVFIPQR